jgi:hypothetical protein
MFGANEPNLRDLMRGSFGRGEQASVFEPERFSSCKK